MADDVNPTPRSHLLIAGTGRAGTSFLVRYLSALGLDTTLSRSGAAAHWDDNANAGLEALPLAGAAADLPYVIKTPWAYEVVNELLHEGRVRLDAAILPMRDLVEAASSRTVLELRALHENLPWMAELSQTWETWGQTPGGAVYSLHPVDQARLLATGFHRLVDRLTQAEVPMLFLAFPRFVRDADYLYSQLRPLLPPGISREAALVAHAAIADAGKVRVGQELASLAPVAATPPTAAAGSLVGPSFAELDRVALARELTRQRAASAQAQAETQRQLHDANARSALDAAALHAAELHAAAQQDAIGQAQVEVAALRVELQRSHDEAAQQREQSAAREQRCAELTQRLVELEAERARQSASWWGRAQTLIIGQHGRRRDQADHVV